jgi:hypothetical protein
MSIIFAMNKTNKTLLIFLFGLIILNTTNNHIIGKANPFSSVITSPFIGYHIFNTSSEVKNNPDVGIKLRYPIFENIVKNVYIDGRISALLTIDRSKEDPDSLWTSSFEAGISHSLKEYATFGPFSPYIKVGVMDTAKTSYTMYIGFGLNYNDKNNVKSLEVLNGSDSLFAYSPYSFNLQKNEDIIPEPKNIEKKIPAELSDSLVVSKFITFFEFTKKTFEDISKHWAKSDIEWAATLGIIKAKDNNNFEPKKPIAKTESANLIASTTIAYALEKHNKTNISYSIPNISKPVNIRLDIYNPKQEIIFNLVNTENQQTGIFSKDWNGKTKDNKLVRSGSYKIHLTISDSQSDFLSPNILLSEEKVVNVRQIPDAIKYLGFDTNKYPIELNNIILPKDILNTSSDQPISRVNFFVLLGRAITRTNPNLTIPDTKLLQEFKDVKQIPTYAKEDLATVIKELGSFGNKETKELYPNRNLSRAEAIIIIKKFYTWLYTNKI